MSLRSPQTVFVDRPEGCASNASNLSEEVAQLRAALVSNRRISMAMGILMRDRNLDEDAAFAAMRRLSQHSNRKLREIAEDVIDHRGLPPERAEGL